MGFGATDPSWALSRPMPPTRGFRDIPLRYRIGSHPAFQLDDQILHCWHGADTASLARAAKRRQSRFATKSELAAQDEGVFRVKSAYPMAETLKRLKMDIAAKGIPFFSEIDQSKLASDAGVKLRPSTLLVFGNPPLGTLFLTSEPAAGLDWPVRLLVHEDEKGDVWAVYTDFGWIARRHGIKDRNDAFATASGLIASITSSVKAR